MNNLEKLKELTEQLPSFEDLVINSGSATEVETIKGNIFMFGLYNVPEISVARAFMSAGSEIESHTHAEFELFVVYEGKMVLNVEGEEFEVEVRQSGYVLPNMPHSAYFPVDTKVIAIAIPSSGGYPDAT